MVQKPMKLNLNTGKLSGFLGIKPEDNIDITLLQNLLDAKIPGGQHNVTVPNPSKLGKKQFVMTDNKNDDNYIGTIHKMVNFAINAKKSWNVGK
jgi:hypothetical protein